MSFTRRQTARIEWNFLRTLLEQLKRQKLEQARFLRFPTLVEVAQQNIEIRNDTAKAALM
jgi:hypothetical protein